VEPDDLLVAAQWHLGDHGRVGATQVCAIVRLRDLVMQEVPPIPTRPPEPKPDANKVSCFGFLILSLFLCIGGTVLYFLTLGALGPFIFVAVGLMLLIGTQYMLWGRWMEKVLNEGQTQADDE
jgi:hypothetical protein